MKDRTVALLREASQAGTTPQVQTLAGQALAGAQAGWWDVALGRVHQALEREREGRAYSALVGARGNLERLLREQRLAGARSA